MKHIMRFESYSVEERTNDILDKISSYGVDGLTALELKFLKSFETGEQQSVHDEIKLLENERIFEDDSGLFKFEYSEIQDFKNERRYIGTIYVPDLELVNTSIKGCLNGYIIKHRNGQTSLEFEKDGYDIFEFCYGIEYELDSFIDYVVSEIDQKVESND